MKSSSQRLVSAIAIGAMAIATTSAVPAQDYDVASVRPSARDATRGGIVPTDGRLSVVALTVKELIALAYGSEGALYDDQIVGGPEWISTQRFDIQAIARPGPGPSAAGGNGLLPMIRSVLSERFKLRVREETRDLPAMALVTDRADKPLGPGLRPTALDCETLAATNPARGCGRRRVTQGMIIAEGLLIGSLAQDLSRMAGVNRLVIDRTGLTGRFDVDLQFNPDPLAVTPALPTLFTALREQLGLRLESQRTSARVVVVDSVELPTPN